LVAGDRRVRLEWQAPDANGSDLLGYRVEWTGGSKECPSSPCSVTGLVNGLAYTFRVLALSSSGDSPLSMPSMLAFPAGPPKAATKAWVKPTAAKKAAISWAGASGNGVRILRYEVSWKAAAAKSFGPWKSAGGKTTFVMTGLSKGKKYQARVRVVTAKGVAISKTIAFTQTK
jgi:hypothetical protein